jgi:hypothetical protein
MLNTYIYRQLPTTGFGVSYTIVMETIAMLAQKLYALCNAIGCNTLQTAYSF